MGSLFKRKTNGRKAKVWSGEYRDGQGKLRRVALFSDKGLSKKRLAALERQAELERAGQVDRYAEHRQRPLADHLSDYLRHLEAKANTPGYVAWQRQRLKAVCGGCGFNRLTDLDAGKVAVWLAAQRKSRPKFGKVTSNNYVTSIKGLSRWLWTSRRSPDDPLIGLAKLDASDDLRHPRRYLSSDELARLLAATRASGRTVGRNFRLSPEDRYVLYLTAAFTGLRSSELAGLAPADITFVGVPSVRVRAAISKNRKLVRLPLNSEVAPILQDYLAGRPECDLIWPGDWAVRRRGAAFLRGDLADAGIEYRTDEGFADFHSLRATFVTSLALANVPLAHTQKLARHSTPALTNNVYNKLREASDLAPAVNMLSVPKLGAV